MAESSIEQSSYSRASYRTVQKLRERGTEYGVTIPELQYPLPRDASGRLALKILMVLAAALIALGGGLLIWGAMRLVAPIVESASHTTDLFNAVKDIPVINLLGTIPAILIWGLVVLLLGGAVAIVAALATYLYKLFRLGGLSMPEKAVGYYLGEVRTSALTTGILLLVIAVLALIGVTSPLVGLLFLFSSGVLFAIFGVLQHIRHQTKAQFKQLPAAQQADFQAHNKALASVQSYKRLRQELQTPDYRNLGKFGWLLALLDGFIEARLVYHNLKKSEQFRDTSTGLARRSLWLLLRTTLTILITAGLAFVLIKFMFVHVVFMQIIAGIIMFVTLLGEFLIKFPLILNYAIKQLKLNHQRLGRVALTLTLVVLAAVIATTAIVIGALMA